MSKQSKLSEKNTGQRHAVSPFTIVNNLYDGKSWDNFSDTEKRVYKQSVWIINRVLSMNIHQLPLVNEIQKYNIPSDIHYLFYANVVPRRRQFNKYVKSKNEVKYESWLIELIAKHYEVSQDEAILYIDIYYKKNPVELRTICEAYAVDPKLIKKAKL